MTKTYSRSDRELLARIAHEVEGIAVSSVREVKWAETEDYIKEEQLARLDRVLDNFDPSVFGKVARAVAAALDDAFLTEGSDAELTEELAEDAKAEIDRRLAARGVVEPPITFTEDELTEPPLEPSSFGTDGPTFDGPTEADISREAFGEPQPAEVDEEPASTRKGKRK